MLPEAMKVKDFIKSKRGLGGVRYTSLPIQDRSPAYWGEKDDIDKIFAQKLGNRPFDLAFYNIPYPQYMKAKRINIVIKNIINHASADHPERPKLLASSNLISGCNFRTNIIKPTDDTDLQYKVWDGGIVLTQGAADKLGVKVGDKVVSRGGLKGIVSSIEPLGVAEMVIGRTKLNQKAIEIEIKESSGYLFVFKIHEEMAKTPFRLSTMSDNFREVMCSDSEIFRCSQWKRDYDYINTIFRPINLKFDEDNCESVDGTDIEIPSQYLNWIHSRHLEVPTGIREFQYQDKTKYKRWRDSFRTPKEERDWERYEDKLKDRYIGSFGLLWKLTNPVTERYYARLIPRNCSLDTVQISAEVKEFVNNQIVMVVREPIISKDNIQFFRIRKVKELEPGVCALNPQVMKGFNADCDGDGMFIINPSDIPIMPKRKPNDKFPVLEGSLEPSGYGEARKPFYSTVDEMVEQFKAEKAKDKENYEYGIEKTGFLRKKVIALVQHAGFDIVDKVCRAFDVEAAMSKFGKGKEITPKEYYSYLKDFHKQLQTEYTPTSVGQYTLDTLNNNVNGLKKLKDTYNAEDQSNYAKILRGNYGE